MLQKKWLAIAAWVAVGSLGSVALGRLTPEARASLPPAPEWSYYCFDVESSSKLTEKANQAAARGWELFAGSPGSKGSIWCLRRPGSSPLRDAPSP
jgi:hypothetical protein